MTRLIRPVIPTPVLISLMARRAVAEGEPELRLLPDLLGSRGCLIDIGANDGPYSVVALACRRPVIAFEPIPDVAQRLRASLRGRAVVHEVAVSDRTGEAQFFIPESGDTLITTRGALDAETHREYSQREIKVPVMTLDSFDLRDVATIKIDVEGHEAQVLTGAIETLKREHPTLLVEIEDQRTPGAMGAVRRVLDPLGYQAMFLFEGQVLPLSDFNPSVHQRVDRAPQWGDPPSDRFVNNFMWFPDGRPPIGRQRRLGHQPRLSIWPAATVAGM
jgi:FkbM family methyltransferase